jgi:hypothetical protein
MNEAGSGACETTATIYSLTELGRLSAYFCPASSLRFGDARAGFLAQDPFGPEPIPADMTESVQSLPHAYHLLFETGIFIAQGSDYLIQVGH